MKKAKKKTKEIVVRQNEISGFIEKAIEKNLPVETMERLFTLRSKWKADQAKEAFVASLANFQSEVPIITKKKKVLNKDGSLRYLYAPMDSVIQQIRKHLADSGFSYTWDSTRDDQHIKVVCKLIHIEGHSEQSSFDIPIEKSQFMTSPQSYATAQSYAKRYTLLNVLGIGTADEDTDATDTGHKTKIVSKKSEIMHSLKRLGRKTDTKRQIEKGVKDIAHLDLVEKNYDDIIDRLGISINDLEV